MKIIFDNEQEKASARQACDILEDDNEFLADAWNQDLYNALKAAAS